MHKKLFIPGPTEVIEESLKAMGTPMIGHRMPEYATLHGNVTTKLKKLLHTDGPVFLGTCSSTGWMEGAVRNCVAKRCVNFVNGAFSKRWHDITLANALEADMVEVEWGKPITGAIVDKALATGKYDAITFVHNETSTGVMSPIAEIAAVIKKYPDVAFLVDSVSSMAGLDLNFKDLGIDVLLAGVQKAFGLPAGLAVCAVSEKAMERSRKATNKGLYFDFVDFEKYDKKNNTPSTPCISQIYALDQKLESFFKETLETRYARHMEMATYVRNWAKENFEMFPEEGYASVTLSTIKNTKEMNIGKLNEFLATKGVVIANGYGDLKNKTFRIAHMADCTIKDIKELIGWIDEFRNQ
jgi:aspartate aminotransferase-like enzyme